MCGSGARATSIGSVVGPNTGLGRFFAASKSTRLCCERERGIALENTQDFCEIYQAGTIFSSSLAEPRGFLRSLGIYQYFLTEVLAESRPDPQKEKKEA
jgi:hypothetical protein